ncbi:uncharacterized protein LOC110735376 [Chenopodium quinoa]|uniref:uncharacterized protein LOC110735376 n=1 Tax=Chenopodium quinoa TaxID=63459 RepID=UPI000B7849FC|nr:uncharacterized protein LOC110735376 [Chenopodium quinoa]
MTVFSHTSAAIAGKQIFPVNYEAEVSQRLLDSLSSGDLKAASDCSSNSFLDVNFVGAVSLKLRRPEVVLRDHLPNDVVLHYEEFKTDVTPLFLAAHFGNFNLLRQLLNAGADVNQKLFRGFAITAAVREGHLEIVKVLLKAGASQPACEQALLEASIHGRARFVELLMGSDLIRPHVALHAFVTACGRGFTDVVDTMIKCGVDTNAMDRVLLQSSKPSLHANIDCNGLVAAVVSRQPSVVRLLLQADITDMEVKLGAWSWDSDSGEEFRVGAGLAEPYPLTWCAVEYFEISGAILRMLLKKHSPNTPHLGRTLLHHAILCASSVAVNVLIDCGVDIECPVTTSNTLFRPLHMAVRLGLPTIIRALLEAGCDINSRTNSGDTALMISAKFKQEECLRVLAAAGADFGLINDVGFSVASIASSNKWSLGFQETILQVIKAGKVPQSSNFSTFSPLLFAAQVGDTEALKILLAQPEIDINQPDDNGFTAVLLTALKGHVESFRLLVYAKADVKRSTKSGDTVITLSELSCTRDLFEKVLLDYALEMDNRYAVGFHALHCAARQGDLGAVQLLTSKGYDVNAADGDGYTPLMLAAREGHAQICKLLIMKGASCDFKNSRGETPLSFARKNGRKDNEAEGIILDELARKLVRRGACVQKHTKRGRGSPHAKMIKMVGATGVLTWGTSSRRNVICKEVEVGPSARFCKNRRSKGDADEAGVFHVVTTKNKEVHFVCEGGCNAAKLWVRGIKLLTKEAVFSSKLNGN